MTEPPPSANTQTPLRGQGGSRGARALWAGAFLVLTSKRMRWTLTGFFCVLLTLGIHAFVQVFTERAVYQKLQHLCTQLPPQATDASLKSFLQQAARSQGFVLPFENIFVDRSALPEPAPVESVGYVLPLTLSLLGVISYPIVIVRTCVPQR